MLNQHRSGMTRRSFHRIVAGGAAAWLPQGTAPAQAAMIDSKVSGVLIGAQSYSFRDRDLDAAIQAMKAVGLGECELYSGHLERLPGGESRDREQLRQWRLTTPLAEFEAVGKKFRDAGIDPYAFNYSFRDDFTDAEIERGFEMAKAIGAKVITASSNVTTARRIDPYARKHRIRVGMHNHSRIRENEFATPDDFAAARKGMSEYIAINLDIGHFVAAGFDPVEYIKGHHADILTLHIKDRKKDQGPNVPFGEGDTPIKEVLALLRDSKYAIPANIEYEYEGEDTVAEVRKCYEYCKQALR
jgi:sugar phosphate isomerase/epimerase